MQSQHSVLLQASSSITQVQPLSRHAWFLLLLLLLLLLPPLLIAALAAL
jgi:hypothetical protein